MERGGEGQDTWMRRCLVGKHWSGKANFFFWGGGEGTPTFVFLLLGRLGGYLLHDSPDEEPPQLDAVGGLGQGEFWTFFGWFFFFLPFFLGKLADNRTFI